MKIEYIKEKDNALTSLNNIGNINFLEEIIDGFSKNPKRLSSKYFYDKQGDRLFQSIMAMPEYYLTDCELDIFKYKTTELAAKLVKDFEPFDLIELGAGDAMKTFHLLMQLCEQNQQFTYMPIDISGNILDKLSQQLSKNLPELDIILLEGEYLNMLDKADSITNRKKIVLFLGSNIGNMELQEAQDFCKAIRSRLNKGDLLLIGFDLMKNPQLILNAYNDESGLTAKFNLNLLARINRELDGNFDLSQFQHYPTYDPVSGACRSYLISLIDQEVMIGESKISFLKNEPIAMEVSQKFSKNDIKALAENSGFEYVDEIYDSKKWFLDAIWKVN